LQRSARDLWGSLWASGGLRAPCAALSIANPTASKDLWDMNTSSAVFRPITDREPSA
jgi:hypothetical protein